MSDIKAVETVLLYGVNDDVVYDDPIIKKAVAFERCSY
jgi:hypothetical protein